MDPKTRRGSVSLRARCPLIQKFLCQIEKQSSQAHKNNCWNIVEGRVIGGKVRGKVGNKVCGQLIGLQMERVIG